MSDVNDENDKPDEPDAGIFFGLIASIPVWVLVCLVSYLVYSK